MGTRKRSGKGHHDKKETDNGKIKSDSHSTAQTRRSPFIIIVVLSVVLVVTAPFLIQYYKEAGSGIMGYILQVANKESLFPETGFSQDHSKDDYTGTEQQHSPSSEKDVSGSDSNLDDDSKPDDLYFADDPEQNLAAEEIKEDLDQKVHIRTAGHTRDTRDVPDDGSVGQPPSATRSRSEPDTGAADDGDDDVADSQRRKENGGPDEDKLMVEVTDEEENVQRTAEERSEESRSTDSVSGVIEESVEFDGTLKEELIEKSDMPRDDLVQSEHDSLRISGLKQAESEGTAELPEKVEKESPEKKSEQTENVLEMEAVPVDESAKQHSLEAPESSDTVSDKAGESAEKEEQALTDMNSAREDTLPQDESIMVTKSLQDEVQELSEPPESESPNRPDSQRKEEIGGDNAKESRDGHAESDSVKREQEKAAKSDDKNNKDGMKNKENVQNIPTEDGKQHSPDTGKTKKSSYPRADITNTADNRIRNELDEADNWLEKRLVSDAQKAYKHVLTRYPHSPRANYGLAQTLCKQAEEQFSNKLLEQCIEQYEKMLDLPDVPRTLMLRAGRMCAERQQFRGWGYKAVKLLKRLLELYPDEVQLWNELGVQHLMVGRSMEAKSAFTRMLQYDPQNIYAKAHLGFIFKTSENNPSKAVPLLREALMSGDKTVQDGRFFFHLGDSLQRLGNVSEAYEWYEKGELLGLFRSKHQRSLYNVEHLTGRPWWTKQQTGQEKLIQTLEDNWQIIRDEGLANIDKTGAFRPEDENLREKGDWKQFTLFQQGHKNEENCRRAPQTCALIERFPAAAMCKRGQVKYSIMQPDVHVWPHCGPTNCRIRMHLGLVVEKDCCRIRVVDDTRSWQEGKVIVFDDSFEHEVWHNGTKLRLVLIVDIWHPELSSREKAALTPI